LLTAALHTTTHAYTSTTHTCTQSLDGGINVIQLETAAGAAIKNFSGAVG